MDPTFSSQGVIHVACPTCSSDNPEVASYCNRCGTSLRGGDEKRTASYAVQSAEGVTQFALISTVMPPPSRRSADNYRWAMILSGVLILGATALGLLPIAIAAAAFLVPFAYLVYIDDVNLWEEAPAAVVVGLFVATGALARIGAFAILAALVIKIRMMLQVALLEAAVEAAAKGDGSEDKRSTFVE